MTFMLPGTRFGDEPKKSLYRRQIRDDIFVNDYNNYVLFPVFPTKKERFSMVKIKDVANAFCVSTATVSRVLANKQTPREGLT